MLLFTYNGGKQFLCLMRVLKLTKYEEAEFRIDGQGLHSWQCNIEKTTLTTVDIPSYAFYEFNVTEEVRFWIDLYNLLLALKNADRDDFVEWGLEDNALVVTLRGETLARSFKIPLIEVERERVEEIRKFNSEATIIIDIKTLRKILEDAGDIITIIAQEDSVFFNSNIEDMEYSVHLKKEDLISLKCKKKVKSAYKTSYLKEFVKAIQPMDVETVTINFASNKPLNMTVKLFMNEEKVERFIAPHVR